MSLQEYLKPANAEHSIVEAVLSVFFVNPIIAPVRFQDLLKEGKPFYNQFQNFRVKKSQRITANFANQNLGVDALNVEQSEDVGFLMEEFNAGNLEWAVQYETHTRNNVLSIHSLNYTRWDAFIQKCRQILKTIAAFEKGIYVHMIGLTYKDEFNWTGKDNLSLTSFFNDENDYIPKVVLNASVNWNYNCTYQSKAVHDFKTFENLNCFSQKISPNNQIISLSHNTAFSLREIQFPFDEENIDNKIINNSSQIHELNKSFLRNVLKEDVLKLIGLS